MNNLSKNSTIILISALSILLVACSDKTIPIPEKVIFKKTALYPEGIEYDSKQNHFLVTSLREGTVGAVKDNGSYTLFAQAPEMVSSIGIRIDEKRDRVLVCNSDPGASIHTKKETQGKLAGLAVFQLSSGKLIKYIDLAKDIEGSHFCNDIALAKDGSAYISDSFSTIIYKVDTNYNSSVLINNKRFAGKGFNLNGLVVKDNYLLVAKYNEGILFKVPLDKPETFSQIKITETFPGADGLLWAADGSLVLIANASAPNASTNQTVKLSSTDNWASAKVVSAVDTGSTFATTGVLRGGKIYALYAMLHVLFNPETKQHIEHFGIHQQKL